MPVGRFVYRLPNDVVVSGQNVGDDHRVFDLVFYGKRYPIAYRNRVGYFKALDFEFALQPPLIDVPIGVTNVVPGTC
jgi:hypothetical protein